MPAPIGSGASPEDASAGVFSVAIVGLDLNLPSAAAAAAIASAANAFTRSFDAPAFSNEASFARFSLSV